MKKALALLVAVSLVFGAMTVTLADKKTPAPTKTPKVTVASTATPAPTVTPAPKVKTPTVKATKSGKFVIFSGTTTVKAHVRILVNNKIVAAGQADSKGKYSIKVEAKKLTKEAVVFAYIIVKGKVEKSAAKKVVVPVTPSPTATPAPSATVAPTVAPTATATPAPSATATPAPSATPVA